MGQDLHQADRDEAIMNYHRVVREVQLLRAVRDAAQRFLDQWDEHGLIESQDLRKELEVALRRAE